MGGDSSLRPLMVPGKPGLNLDNIRSMTVALPPLAEQQELCRRVRALMMLADNIEWRATAAAAHIARALPAILSKAFAGELVPTEAELAQTEGREFETATQLLRRVLTEREAQEPVKVGQRRRVSEDTSEGPKRPRGRAAAG